MGRCANRGFTYISAILVVALMGAASAAVGEMWHTASRREKELQLLFVGNQYRDAIGRYYLRAKAYPRTLPDLLKDPGTLTTQRYLRKLYPDPITGTSEWGIVKAPDGGVMGVFSRSDEPPIKKSSFRLRDRDFESAKTYADWKFLFSPALKPPAGQPSITPASPSAFAPPATPSKPAAPVPEL